MRDLWAEDDFQTYSVPVEGNQVTMGLAEKQTVLDGVKLREVRKLNTGSHQTSVLTTHPTLELQTVALYMFARWSQENFFRYMRQDYVFDKISQYTVDKIDAHFEVVNPTHRNYSHQIQKTREKIQRRNAQLYVLKEESANTDIDKAPKQAAQQNKIQQEIDSLKQEEKQLLEKREKVPYKTTIKDMGENRYNKLNTESKLFLNVIKMICYRAETSMANLLEAGYKKYINEKRSLVKSIIDTPCDLQVDYNKNTLQVKLHTLATPRDNLAIKKICETLNQNQCKYPGTDLTIIYQSAT